MWCGVVLTPVQSSVNEDIITNNSDNILQFYSTFQSDKTLSYFSVSAGDLTISYTGK